MISNFRGTPDEVEEGDSVRFRWTASDPDGDSLTCSISFGDGASRNLDSCSGSMETSYRYYDAGAFNVLLIVSDGRGGQTSAHERIYVDEPAPSNRPPTINSFNASASSWSAPADVTFSWNITDPDSSDLLTCAISFGDGSADRAFPNCRTTTSYTHRYQQAGSYTAVLVVSDPFGDSDSTNRRVTIDAPQAGVPVITSVRPSSPWAVTTGQTLDIYGSGFVFGAGVALVELSTGDDFDVAAKASFINSGHIRLTNVVFGLPAGPWQVIVRNYPGTSSAVSSAPFTFYTR